jgi:hypothetical protein
MYRSHTRFLLRERTSVPHRPVNGAGLDKNKDHYKETKMSRCRLLSLLIVIAFMIFTTIPALAAENHCITPLGTDLNIRYGISIQIVTPFCTQVDTGESWTTPGGTPWFMNTSFVSVPEGFIAAGGTPLEDFLTKFTAAKVVVDSGTSEEKTYTFPKSDKLWMDTLGGFPAVQTVTLTILKPLSVGSHTVQLYWVFSAMHCDGFGDVVQDNCLGPGEVAYGPLITFQVTPGSNKGH